MLALNGLQYNDVFDEINNSIQLLNTSSFIKTTSKLIERQIFLQKHVLFFFKRKRKIFESLKGKKKFYERA